MGRSSIEEKHPEIPDLLGKQSDTSIAKQFGVPNASAGKRMGIPRFSPCEARAAALAY